MYARILVPVDGSATAEHGLREALALAAESHARVTLLNVLADDPVWLEGAPASVAEVFRTSRKHDAEELVARHVRLATEAGVTADGIVRDASRRPVSDVVIEEARARHCDLIVMGTHGRRGF